MSKVEKVFAENKKNGKETLVGYFPAGFPTVEQSVEACIAMCENGIDVLEIGVPYSDPVMDGLVIQKATELALENGFRLSDIFEIVKRVSARVSTPLLVMTYWNPVMQFGVRRFAEKLKEAGGAGLITPDLIVDEANEWLQVSDELELDRVFLATPTSTQERTDSLVAASRGFVYTVSTMGTTGERADLDGKARAVVAKIRNSSEEKFTAVGIGISTRDQVVEVNNYADGAIVGSLFINAYSAGGVDGLVESTRSLSNER
ncbi:MAG: tryptophan synthase subunit alpha [Actinobacteria bacterium]|uniref:tryptophan synthase n=1 Tax=freshwater metagenome TaxID=449393 RepID=A0A6J6HB76_9ZZZZ|nr:tryptophan synthase subunit alpha [Actinomycetota bacterium]